MEKIFPTFCKYRRELGVLAVTAAALACLILYGNKGWKPDAATAAETGFRSHAESVRLLRKIYALNALKLPDEWYFAKTSAAGGLKERFAATSALMRKKDADAPGPERLMARYHNGGSPFMDPVWFNHPIICRRCSSPSGAGEITIVSLSAGLTSRVGLEDIHDIENHDGSFTFDQSDALKRIFGEIPRKH